MQDHRSAAFLEEIPNSLVPECKVPLMGRFRSRPTVLLELALFSGMISLLYSQVPSKTDRTPIKTTVCEALSHPETLDGKLVEIHADFYASWEGAGLSDGKCEGAGELVRPFQHGLAKPYADALRGVAKRYGLDDVVRDQAWREFDSASRRLYTGMGETLPDGTTKWGDYGYISADFAGVLVIKRNFRVKNGFGNGWGHLGMSRFLLVVRSVSNVSPHPCACPSSGRVPPALSPAQTAR